MGILARSEGGTWASDRHPHEPKIKRQLASNGACFICELMEETRVAEQRLRGAVALSDAEAEALDRLLDAYIATEEADPGLDDLRAIRVKLACRGGQPSPAGCPACSRDPKIVRPPHTCSGEQS